MLGHTLLKVMSARLSTVGIKSLKYSDPSFQVEVGWDITQRCNYSCSYCASYDNTQPFNFKTLEEYTDALDYLSDYFGNMRIKVDILGGEPTLFKKWFLLMNHMNSRNFLPKLTTNLSVPVDTYINKLDKDLPPFIVASYHPEFAILDEFCYNLEKLKERNFLKGISILGDPNHWDRSIKVYNRLKKIMPSLLLTKIKNEHTSDYSITNDFVEYTDEQLKYFGVNPTEDKNYTVEFKDGSIGNPSISEIRFKYSNFKGMKCAVGKYRLHINPNGDVYPSACLGNYPKAMMGNIYKQNIRKANSAITCPFSSCLCGPDIRIEKWTQM